MTLRATDGAELHVVDQWRPGRNYVRPGDRVRCRPPVGHSFVAIVKRIYADRTEHVREVEVYGGPPGRASVRQLRAEAVRRVAQTRAGAHRP